MTSAIRLEPPFAGVFAQMPSKVRGPPCAGTRGLLASWESALTANRKPCTSPSAGRAVDGPWVAYCQPLPERSQNDQYR